MTPVLYTDRLFLRPVGEPNVAALTAHWNDPLVQRHLWDDATVADETVAAIVAASLRGLEAGGATVWSLHEGEAAPLVGAIGLRRINGDDGGDVELVYSLAPASWGCGLATEAAAAVLAFVFETLALPRVLAVVDVANEASLRVARRLGMCPLGPAGPGRSAWATRGAQAGDAAARRGRRVAVDVCLAAPERVWALVAGRRAGRLGLGRRTAPGSGRGGCDGGRRPGLGGRAGSPGPHPQRPRGAGRDRPRPAGTGPEWWGADDMPCIAELVRLTGRDTVEPVTPDDQIDWR